VTVSLDPSGDQWEIRQLVERYANAVDRRDSAAVAALFADDGELEVWLEPDAATSALRRGHDDIAAAIARISTFRATQHVISNSVADIDGDSASGATHCTAHHVGGDGADGHDQVLYIRYLDSFARIDGRWRIKRRELRVQWISVLGVESI
jgi:uncharacterized protein (TIGR02246 family)